MSWNSLRVNKNIVFSNPSFLNFIEEELCHHQDRISNDVIGSSETLSLVMLYHQITIILKKAREWYLQRGYIILFGTYF